MGLSPIQLSVLEFLQRQFKDRLISSRTLIRPPRSPDLNPLDFYLWGHIKQKISKMDWTTIDELKVSNTATVRSINQDKLLMKRVVNSLGGRISTCLEAEVKHLVHGLN